jgi:peptide/nickel transport system ATP-binding protein
MAPTEELYRAPRHPYTAALMSAVPVADPRIRSGMTALQGEVPSPANPPSGCYFHPRCPYATEVCVSTPPALEEVAPGHFVSCHRAKELALAGIDAPPARPPASDQSSARPRPT